MRRTRKRDDGRSSRIPGTRRPALRPAAYEENALIANTSNMPVAAREASIYTGITIAEYFRDMGYPSRLWPTRPRAGRKLSAKCPDALKKCPAKKDIRPTSVRASPRSTKERAARYASGKDGREGAVSVIGAVSPPGGDLSEPVTQNTPASRRSSGGSTRGSPTSATSRRSTGLTATRSTRRSSANTGTASTMESGASTARKRCRA